MPLSRPVRVAHRDRHGGVSCARASPVRCARIRRSAATCSSGPGLHRIRLSHRALFELMFTPGELRAKDAELVAAQQQAIGALTSAVSRLGETDTTPTGAPKLALISWALVHGLVVLARDGALQAAAAPEGNNAAELAYTLTDQFTEFVAKSIAL